MTADEYLWWQQPKCNKPYTTRVPNFVASLRRRSIHNWRHDLEQYMCEFSQPGGESHPGRLEEAVQMEVRVGWLKSQAIFVLFLKSPTRHSLD